MSRPCDYGMCDPIACPRILDCEQEINGTRSEDQVPRVKQVCIVTSRFSVNISE